MALFMLIYFLTRPQSSLNARRQRGLTVEHGVRMIWEREGLAIRSQTAENAPFCNDF